jgi:hypothetical protein
MPSLTSKAAAMLARPVGLLASSWVLACALDVQCVAAETETGSLADLSLEELSNIEITNTRSARADSTTTRTSCWS